MAVVILGIIGVGALFIKHAIAAPASAAARNLAAINGLTVGTTTEAELLARKEFQTVERKCFQSDCQYLMATENAFLNRLHLAPVTRMFTAVTVRDGLIIRISVVTLKAGLPGISVSQMLEMPPGCASSPCVRRQVLPNKVLMGISIAFSNDSGIRNHIPEAVNSECLSRLHGCNTYADLMPLTKELNLEATGR